MSVARVALIATLLIARAHAAPAVIAAMAPGDRGALTAVVIGPNGQAYAPDGKGTWTRESGAAIADDVARATRAGSTVIAGVAAGPPYALHGHVWDLVVLGLHAKAVLGRGPRATAAFGKQVFDLETGKPTRLTDAPGVVAMLAASAKAVVVQTDQGLAKSDGKRWKPIANAPKQVLALLDDHWALVERGLLDLTSQRLTAWPAGFVAGSVIAVTSELVVAAGVQGGLPTLVTVKKSKLDKEPIGGAKLTSAIVSIVADTNGHVVVATREGQIAVRDKAGAWTAGAIAEQPVVAHPGSPPAESK